MTTQSCLGPICLLLGLHLAASPAGAAEPASHSRATLEGFEQIITNTLTDWNIPGLAMAVVKDGEIIWSGGFGQRDVERKLPVTTNTVFGIGSTTKAFTTFVMGTLVDEGRLDWDKPVRSYISEFQLFDRSASELCTARDLVTHRTGVPRHDMVWVNNSNLTREGVMRRLAALEPSEAFRAKYQYNNLMFITAGYLVERITTNSWEDNVRHRILTPLGMTNTFFFGLDLDRAPDAALSYSEVNGALTNLPPIQARVVGPAGTIHSSVTELSRWMAMLLNRGRAASAQLIQSATLADVLRPQVPVGIPPSRTEFSDGSYASGWGVQTYRGHRFVSHGGAIDGYRAEIGLFPDDRIGIAILHNGGNGVPNHLLRGAADQLLGLAPVDWYADGLKVHRNAKKSADEAKDKTGAIRKPGTSPSHDLPEYVGEYEHAGYGIFRVEQESNGLRGVYNQIFLPLKHWHYDVFNVAESPGRPLSNLKLNFRTDAEGNVASVEIPFESSLSPIPFKRRPDGKLSSAEFLARVAGTFELKDRTITLTATRDGLVWAESNQPLRHLLPDLGGVYRVKERPGRFVKIKEESDGSVVGFDVIEAARVFAWKRKN